MSVLILKLAIKIIKNDHDEKKDSLLCDFRVMVYRADDTALRDYMQDVLDHFDAYKIGYVELRDLEGSLHDIVINGNEPVMVAAASSLLVCVAKMSAFKKSGGVRVGDTFKVEQVTQQKVAELCQQWKKRIDEGEVEFSTFEHLFVLWCSSCVLVLHSICVILFVFHISICVAVMFSCLLRSLCFGFLNLALRCSAVLRLFVTRLTHLVCNLCCHFWFKGFTFVKPFSFLPPSSP